MLMSSLSWQSSARYVGALPDRHWKTRRAISNWTRRTGNQCSCRKIDAMWSRCHASVRSRETVTLFGACLPYVWSCTDLPMMLVKEKSVMMNGISIYYIRNKRLSDIISVIHSIRLYRASKRFIQYGQRMAAGEAHAWFIPTHRGRSFVWCIILFWHPHTKGHAAMSVSVAVILPVCRPSHPHKSVKTTCWQHCPHRPRTNRKRRSQHTAATHADDILYILHEIVQIIQMSCDQTSTAKVKHRLSPAAHAFNADVHDLLSVNTNWQAELVFTTQVTAG